MAKRYLTVVDRFGGVRGFPDIASMCRKMNLDYNSVYSSLRRNGKWFDSVLLIQWVEVEKNERHDVSHLVPYQDAFREKWGK
jgi:hypothetical protein